MAAAVPAIVVDVENAEVDDHTQTLVNEAKLDEPAFPCVDACKLNCVIAD